MRTAAMLDDALGVLLGDELADVVDLVLLARDGAVEAHGRIGAVRFAPGASGFAVTPIAGADPLARQDPGAFSPLAAELAALRPAHGRNHYPYAHEAAWSLFTNRRAPDLAVVHTPAHNWEERGGHRGEHGSLDVVQSRAPLVLAGAGIKRLGRIERHARMVDIAPTLALLAGADAPAAALLRGQQGRVLDEVLDPAARPARVAAFLWDGTNANVLAAMADAGELPTVARLMAEGTTFAHGCVASFPSVTLANHTTALTGVHPGVHGVLHNSYYDRDAGRQIVTNAPDRWHLARDEIGEDVETVFEVLGRTRRFTAAVNEPADRGAGYATFDVLRAGDLSLLERALPDAAATGGSREHADQKREYGFASAADALAVRQVVDLWTGAAGAPRPVLLWVNLILPDAANHAGGPYSEIGHAGLRDTDRRLGEILDAMDWGAGETAFVLLADHGMEESDPACTGDWDRALAAAGVPFRDEGYGFVYLDP